MFTSFQKLLTSIWVVTIFITYFWVYPVFAGDNISNYNISYSDAESGIVGTSWASTFTFTAPGTQIFTAWDMRGNSVQCNPTSILSNNTLIGVGSCVQNILPVTSCQPGYIWDGYSCVYDTAPIITTVSPSSGDCTNQPVVVIANCTGTGCPVSDTAYDSPSSGVLMAPDKSGLVSPVPWEVHNIDINAPIYQGISIQGRPAGTSMIAQDSVRVSVAASDPKRDPQTVTYCGNTVSISASFYGPLESGGSSMLAGSSNTTINANSILNALNPVPSIYKIGTYNLVISITDNAGNTTTQSISNALKVYPNEPSILNSTIQLVEGGGISGTSLSTGDRSWRYANFIDSYKYQITLKDKYNNPIAGKPITRVNQSSLMTIKTDMSNPNSPIGNDALIETLSTPSNVSGQVFFDIAAKNAGEFAEAFDFDLKLWDDNYQDTKPVSSYFINNGQRNRFKKPYTGKLTIITSPNTLQVGGMQTMSINIQNSGWGSTPAPTQIQMDTSDISATVQGHIIAAFTKNYLSTDLFTGTSNNPLVSLRIESNARGTADKIPSIAYQRWPTLEYTLWGDTIKNRLSPSTNDDSFLTLDGTSFVGISVNGSIQSQGTTSSWDQQEIESGFRTNFTEVAKSVIYSNIRKNAFQLVRSRTSDSIVNNIKYVKWDTTLESNPSYETLIIVDGNLRITDNVDLSKFGIILVRDQDMTKGNIFILPSVGYIKATIYADGAIQSADSSGNPYLVDSASRTNTLQNQLVIYWSIISRNTLGWAILGPDGKYRLPIGVIDTVDFDTALKYDLGYLRRWVIGANPARYGATENASKPTVILYNPDVITNPPLWFFNQN